MHHCHPAANKLPHKEELPPPECKECHADVVAIYKQHGRSKIKDSEDIPSCADCHGSHDIMPVSDSRSMVSHLNLPQTCAKCHDEDQELITRRNIRFKLPIKIYSQSVHGRANVFGSQTAASCNDCHSTGGTAHMILPPGDSRSTINYFNIPSTRVSCHEAHGILPASNPEASISKKNLPESCGKCHAGISLEMANAPIHEGERADVARLVEIIYIWAIIGLMVLHW